MEIEDEHVRYQRYVEMLSEVTPEADREAIGMILGDPDHVMAEAALTTYVDRIGSSYSGFVTWSVEMSPLFIGREFLLRRIREWLLYREVTQSDFTNLAKLVDASNWLQRKVVGDSSVATVLELLAMPGRTKAVRNIAKSQLKQL